VLDDDITVFSRAANINIYIYTYNFTTKMKDHLSWTVMLFSSGTMLHYFPVISKAALKKNLYCKKAIYK